VISRSYSGLSVDLRNNRREAAIRAAQRLGRSIGLVVTAPRVLKDSNNTIVHLAPSPVVAKVGTSHFRDARLEALDRELAVATHLAQKRTPIVRPTSEVRPGPHRVNGLTITLWQYYMESTATAITGGARGRGLAIVHSVLRDFNDRLPWFSVELDDVGRFLADRSRLARLPDRELRPPPECSPRAVLPGVEPRS
jgi:hypothetical protein